MDAAPPDTAVRRPAPRRPVPGFVVALALLAALLLAGTVGPQVAARLGTTDVVTTSVAGVHGVVVDLDDGTVTLRAGAGPGVGLTSTRTWLWGEPVADVVVVDGVLSVVGRCPAVEIGCRISEELMIPHGTTVRVGTGSGAITATGLDVPVLELANRSGTIDAVDVSAARVEVRSDAGGVHVSFLRPPSVASATSRSGPVDMTVPQGRYRVDADAVAVVEVVADPGAARLLVAHSAAGPVAIRPR